MTRPFLAAGLLAAFVCSIPLCGCAESPLIEHRVAKEEVRDLPSHGKLTQYVIVERGATESQLRSVLLALRSEALRRPWKSGKQPGTWIYLYDEEGTAVANPDQWIAMLGSSPGAKPDIRISTTVTKPVSAAPDEAPGRDIIGSWRYSSAGMHWVETLFRESGQVKRETKYDDGSSSVRTVVESSHPDGIKYAEPNNRRGEFVVIHPDGKLGFYDRDGKFGTAMALP